MLSMAHVLIGTSGNIDQLLQEIADKKVIGPLPAAADQAKLNFIGEAVLPGGIKKDADCCQPKTFISLFVSFFRILKYDDQSYPSIERLHDDALVVKVGIEDTLVCHVLIDTGSSPASEEML